MKINACLFVSLFISTFINGQQPAWKIAGNRITTSWASEVNPSSVLPEYPRPQMKRDNNWINLNGLWQYAIVSLEEKENFPASMEGNILVPFAVESALSGVGRTVGKDSILWYARTFTIPSSFRNQKVFMHFGAVDWRCDVFVNGIKVGSHEGGYDPFSFDVTTALKRRGIQEVRVRVWDPTDDGPQPRGKQVVKPSGIWYTPVTGIWQTVWLEAVPKTHIVSIKQTPQNNNSLKVDMEIQEMAFADKLRITAWDGPTKISEQLLPLPAITTTLEIPNAKLWSPSNPFLYELHLAIERNGKVIDQVKSYFAMRKVSLAPDIDGTQRMMLNDQFVFHYGPLDQGWWPDGLYTAPTDQALKFDIEQTRAMGFNMIRKHIKVEPARWYHYCDSLGIMVWQDMPSGDLGNRWEPRPFIIGRGTEKNRTVESEKYFWTDWFRIMNSLHNFPSIVVWVPFNEAWGQFRTDTVVNWTMARDPSRLVNAASGGNYTTAGHIIDMHNYPDPVMPSAQIFGSKHAIVLGEYGGLGLPVQGHTWQDKNWGYQSFGTADSLRMRYEGFSNQIVELIRKGLSAAVYTQTTDVEGETNGMITYDRRIFKIPVDRLRAIHQKFYNPELVKMR